MIFHEHFLQDSNIQESFYIVVKKLKKIMAW